MLKQQLQKTEEEFDEIFCIDYAEVFFGDREELKKQGWELPEKKLDLRKLLERDEVKQFIRQEQIKAVKAFAEEIIEKSECNPMECSYKENINNLLKDI